MERIMDLHTHTIASGHAYNTIYEMAKSASERGLKLLGITEHGPAMQTAVPPNYFNNFKMLPRELYGIRLMFGCELNILDDEGSVDLKEEVLKKMDYTVASIHRGIYQPGTVEQNTRAYIGAMQNPYVNIIGHPDDAAVPVDYERIVCAAKEHHVLLEVNSESLHPRCLRKGAYENYKVMLEFCKKYKVPIVLDSDAHCEIDIANDTRSKALLKEMDFPEDLVASRSLESIAEFIPHLTHK